MYRYFRENNGWNSSIDVLTYRLNDKNINFIKAIIIIDIMAELGIIKVENIGDVYNINLVDIGKKVDLNSSVILSNLK